jgi:Ca2+-binding EF-hand superfamily protein
MATTCTIHTTSSQPLNTNHNLDTKGVPFKYSYPKVVGLLRKQLAHLNNRKSTQAFNDIDSNSSGTIDKLEFKTLMRREEFGNWELTDKAVADFFAHIDPTGSGELDYNQFLAHLRDDGATALDKDIGMGTAAQAHEALGHALYARHKSFVQAFLAIDKDRDGFISENELRTAADHAGVSLGKPELQKLVKQYDEDGDGKICEVDFKGAMREVFFPSEGKGSRWSRKRESIVEMEQAQRKQSAAQLHNSATKSSANQPTHPTTNPSNNQPRAFVDPR